MTKVKNTEEKIFTLLKLDKSKRRWRMLSLLLTLVLLVMFFGSNASLDSIEKNNQNYIAEIKIEGMILEDDYRLKRLEELKDDKLAKAVILTIDSPGGSMVPGLEILEYLQDLAKVKPLVIQMKTIAASAGFLISLSGEHVVANKATLTASVGVLMPLVDATELAGKIGVKSAEITSGDMKSITSPLNKRTDEAQKYLQSTVNDLQQIFMEEVKARRNITAKTEDLIADGRVLIGQKAYEHGLIDAIGNKNTLIEYLNAKDKSLKNLKVEEFDLEEPEEVKFRDILADELTSKVASKLETLLSTTLVTPKM